MTTVASNVVPPPVAPVAPEMKVVVVEEEVKVKVTAAGDAVTDAAVVVEKGEEQMREQEEKDEATVTDLEKLEREKDEETETETERADDRKIEEKIEVKAEQKRRRRQGLEMPVATTAGEACLHLLFSDFEGRLGAVRRSHKRFRKAALEEKKSMGEGDSMLWKQASLALLTEISDALGEEEQGLEKWLSQCQMFASNRPNAL